MPLTDTHIRSLKPDVKPRKYFDGGGLFLFVPANGSKLWRMAYRFDGKSKLLSFGEYPTISLKDARERREEAKRMLSKGIDPSDHKRQLRQARAIAERDSFQNIAREWHETRMAEFSEKHQGTVMYRLETYGRNLTLRPGNGVFPAERIKMRRQHLVPLSRQAMAILQELQKYSGEGKYLFPSIRTEARPISDATMLNALRRMGYQKHEMSVHGFRSIASTLLNELGYNRDWIERQLAHGEQDEVRAAYNYAEYLPERRKMMQAWADYLDGLRNTQQKRIREEA